MSAAAVQDPTYDAPVAAMPALVRQQAAEVLAAHRSRRQRLAVDGQHDPATKAMQREAASLSRSQRIASLVTERYAQTQSYHAFLAAEAEEATRKASAAAEVAIRTAKAVAEAQQELLRELAATQTRTAEASVLPVPAPERVQIMEAAPPEAAPLKAPFAAPTPIEERSKPVAEVSRAGLTVRLYEDAGSARGVLGRPSPAPTGLGAEQGDSEESQALDDEISFRQSPSFDLQRASVPIPGNLLEFPRQLVAARKVRPSYAEGPLREEGEERGEAQLRIFEVDPSQITLQSPVESSAPEWSSIWLDALVDDSPEEILDSEPQVKARPESASLERRAMAALVDACLAGMGFLVFATAFAYTAPALPSLSVALLGSGGTLAAIFLLYQVLFFTLSESTPGMRYARIGLCTFDEENPTHLAMVKRIPATLLAAVPLGLGFLWVCLDEDRLGWHDRLSGMYQRSY